MRRGGGLSEEKLLQFWGPYVFFSHIISLTRLLHIRSEEKQSPNVSEGDCNMEIFSLAEMLMDVGVSNRLR